MDLVVRLRAAHPREREAVADLDALHRLDAHQRRREPRVQAGLPRGVRAETRNDAARAHLDDPADGVALGACSVDALLEVVADDGARDLDADLAEQRLRDGAGGDDHRRVPGTGALEGVAGVGEAVLEHAGEVGVAGPRQRDRLLALAFRLALGRERAHPPRPVLVVAVPDDERERRPERPPVAEARVHLDLVGLDLLARAAAVALLAAAEIRVDRRLVEDEARRQPADDRDQRRAVRLACSDQFQTHGSKPTAARMTSTGAGIPVQSSNDAAPWATSTSRPVITRAPASRAARPVAVSGYGRSIRV